MRGLAAVCAAALLAFPMSPASSAPAPALPSTAEIQRLLDTEAAYDPGTGIVVGILDHGHTTIVKAGVSGTSRPLDEHSLFEIASVTKTFTATILADMVLHHELALTDPAEPWLPSGTHLPSRNGKAITLLSLATQHSGLPREPDNWPPNAAYTWDKLKVFLNGFALPRDPGAEFEYSNLGVSILGTALAGAAHIDYPALVRGRIFAPLGMNETSALALTDLPPALRERVAAGRNQDHVVAPIFNAPLETPAGGIRSSVADMLRFVRCNLGQGPLAADCLFAQQPRDTLPGNRIGLIWWTGDVVPIVYHGGDTFGFHSCIAIAPDHQRGVVVLTNGSRAATSIAEHLLDPLLPVALPVKAAVPQINPSLPPTPVVLDPAVLAQYAGTYPVAADESFTIAAGETGLTEQLTGDAPLAVQAPSALIAAAKDQFVEPSRERRFTFTRDAAGTVTELAIQRNGLVLNLTRGPRGRE